MAPHRFSRSAFPNEGGKSDEHVMALALTLG